MIPTMLVVGLVIGRLWAIPLGGLAWGALLLATGVLGVSGFAFAVVLGGANVAAGVLVHRLVAWPFRRPRAVR